MIGLWWLGRGGFGWVWMVLGAVEWCCFVAVCDAMVCYGMLWHAIALHCIA